MDLWVTIHFNVPVVITCTCTLIKLSRKFTVSKKLPSHCILRKPNLILWVIIHSIPDMLESPDMLSRSFAIVSFFSLHSQGLVVKVKLYTYMIEKQPSILGLYNFTQKII